MLGTRGDGTVRASSQAKVPERRTYYKSSEHAAGARTASRIASGCFSARWSKRSKMRLKTTEYSILLMIMNTPLRVNGRYIDGERRITRSRH